jgi:hypothetical protein
VKYHQANMRVLSGFFIPVLRSNPMKSFALPSCRLPQVL